MQVVGYPYKQVGWVEASKYLILKQKILVANPELYKKLV